MKRIGRFVIAGAFNTGLGYLLYVACVQLGMDYRLALAFEYMVCTLIGYGLSRYWTFSDATEATRTFPKYLLSYFLVFLLNGVMLVPVVEMKLLGPIVGQLLINAVIVVTSFLMQRYVVFKPAVER